MELCTGSVKDTMRRWQLVIDDTGSVEGNNAFIYCAKLRFDQVLPMPGSLTHRKKVQQNNLLKSCMGSLVKSENCNRTASPPHLAHCAPPSSKARCSPMSSCHHLSPFAWSPRPLSLGWWHHTLFLLNCEASPDDSKSISKIILNSIIEMAFELKENSSRTQYTLFGR